METGKRQEASGELAQALQTYEQARQILEVEVARYKESLEKGFVTRKRVEAVEAAFTDAAQAVTRVRARLDAQRPRKK